jgi:flagellar export protein FliJ
MKAFQFRLASVVRIREMQLRTEESKLEQLLAARASIQSAIDNLQQSVVVSWNTSKTFPALQSSDLSGLKALDDHARREGVRLRTRLTAQEELVAKQQSVVIEIRRNLRLLEKLKLKRQTEWQQEADRELAALVDDATNSRWVRRDPVRQLSEI